MDIVFIIAAPLLLSVVIAALWGRLSCKHQAWLLAAGMVILFALLLIRLPEVQSQGAQTFTLEWMPQIGLTFSVYLDGLALLFTLLVTGIGAAVMLYAGYYFEDAQQASRFNVMLLGFTSSMLALVMAGNLITLFIAWELTSVISFLLISFKGKEEAARSGASQALMITGGGGLALFVGLLLMGSAVGSLELADILASGDVLREHAWYTGIVILVLLGAFTKSAQFPFHFWLPGAMSAPTPASSFLHSATMVKAGIYLLARFYPVLGDTPLWESGLVGIGLITMLLSALLALRQRDLKGILAYSTVSQLGALVALIGLPDSLGLKAAMVGIMAHALYKCALFLVVGAVDHHTGTRNIDELRGLRGDMPGFAVVAAIVALSMAGVPPLFGFVGKETLLEAFINQPVPLAVIVLSATLTVTLALRLFWDVFMGAPLKTLPQEEHHAPDAHHPYGDDAYEYSHEHALPRLMSAGPAALAAASVIGGIGIAPLIGPIVETALGKPTTLYLFPPEGINLAFALSLSALVIGTVFFAVRRWWLAIPLPSFVSGAQVYRAVVRGVEAAGDLLLKSQGGKIRYYLATILLAVVLLLSTVALDELALLRTLSVRLNTVGDLLRVVLLGLALVATFASIVLNRHLLAVLALGAAGYAIGGLFLLEPAPDVALVQFLVETLASVLIIVILARTRPQERQQAMERVWGQTRIGIVRDALIATFMGAMVALFALAAVSTRPRPETIAQWHLENALPQVGVNDVVAGIITDFRGMDTLIEITVFGMAGLGVLTLLARPGAGRVMRLRRRDDAPPTIEITEATAEEVRPESLVSGSMFSNAITRLAAALVLPIAILIALSHLLFAGSAPGDGFTAGVIAGLAVALWFIVYGYTETKTRLRWLRPAPLIGIGLSVAFINALLPLAFGRDFMAFTVVDGLSIANIKFASSLLFEIGIALTVVGGIGAIMEAISHPQEVEPL